VACFDVSLGCSGFVYALSVAKGFMLGECKREALIITCDPYSKCISKSNREVAALFGDAAAAVWMRSDGAGAIGSGDFGTDGSGAENLIVKQGGAAYPHTNIDGVPAASPNEHDCSLRMNGRAIFNFMMGRIQSSVQAALEKNKLSLDEIDFFVFHQASRYLIETLGFRMGLPKEKVYINVSETGNTVSSTIPIALKSLSDSGSLVPGSYVLVSGFGVGLSWATNVIRIL
jgi:3-oxoacyl-[acyl-carrier-protein] synthase-3